MRLLGTLFKAIRIYKDMRAVATGRVHKRIYNRMVGRTAGRVTRKLFWR